MENLVPILRDFASFMIVFVILTTYTMAIVYSTFDIRQLNIPLFSELEFKGISFWFHALAMGCIGWLNPALGGSILKFLRTILTIVKSSKATKESKDENCE